MTLTEKYNQYVQEWIKENPAFSGPYYEDMLEFDQWIEKYMIEFAEWVLSKSYGEDLKLKDDTLEKFKKQK
jgi:hypothetical protein